MIHIRIITEQNRWSIVMWIILGVIAIVATCINPYLYKAGKDYKLAMAMGLSFTALTLCAEYSLVSQ